MVGLGEDKEEIILAVQHADNYIYFYHLGMVDPTNLENVRRARRFAGWYLNEDPAVPNYDPVNRVVRSPCSGHQRITLPFADRSHTLYPHPYRLRGGDLAGWRSIGYDGPPAIEF